MQSPPYIQWPIPSKEEIFFAFVGMLGLILVALGLEFQRQRFVRNRNLKREWQNTVDVMVEKDCSPGEQELMKEVIGRWGRVHPMRVIATRRVYEQCIANEMKRLIDAKNPGTFEEMGQRLRDVRSKLGLDYAPIGQAILSTRDLYIAQILELQHGGKGDWETFVVHHINEAYLYLRPKTKGRRPPAGMSAGTISMARLWRDEDARYAFNLTFERCDTAEDLWVYHHTSELNRYQARAHFRIFYDQTVTIGLLPTPRGGHPQRTAGLEVTDRVRGLVTSLSAGGLAFQIQQPLDAKSLLRFNLDLEHIGKASVDGEIVEIHPGPAGRSLVRVQFTNVDDETRDQIARYVVYRQQAQSAAMSAGAN